MRGVNWKRVVSTCVCSCAAEWEIHDQVVIAALDCGELSIAEVWRT